MRRARSPAVRTGRLGKSRQTWRWPRGTSRNIELAAFSCRSGRGDTPAVGHHPGALTSLQQPCPAHTAVRRGPGAATCVPARSQSGHWGAAVDTLCPPDTWTLEGETKRGPGGLPGVAVQRSDPPEAPPGGPRPPSLCRLVTGSGWTGPVWDTPGAVGTQPPAGDARAAPVPPLGAFFPLCVVSSASPQPGCDEPADGGRWPHTLPRPGALRGGGGG